MPGSGRPPAREGHHIVGSKASNRRGRPWSWITGRPRLADGFLVGFAIALGVIAFIANYFVHRSFEPGQVVFAVLEAVPLWWRRRHPVVVLLVIAIVQAAQWLFGFSTDPSGPALVFAVYAVAVHDRSAVRLWVAAGAIAIILTGVGLIILSDFQDSRLIIPLGATSLVGWLIGAYIRSRRQFMVDLVARHEQEREQAAEEERLRIARELHDVVAHNVSVMAIQAGAARVSGGSSGEALETIETTARDTLAELNRLLGALRKQPDAPLAPQPGLDQVETLLKTAREAGLEATARVNGDRRPLPTALDLSAYRIVQEAITNVLKHANATRVEVTIERRPDSVLLAITDNGTGATEKAGSSTGHGLIGMRERAELFGGEVATGSSSLGGFTVRATLPIK